MSRQNFHLWLASQCYELHKTLGTRGALLPQEKTLSHSVSGPWRLFDVRDAHPSSWWPWTDACSQIPLEVPSFTETFLLLLSSHNAPTFQTRGNPNAVNDREPLQKNEVSFFHPRCRSLGQLQEQGLQPVSWSTGRLLVIWCPRRKRAKTHPHLRLSSLADGVVLLDPSFPCEAAQQSLFTKLQRCQGEGNPIEKVLGELRIKKFENVKNVEAHLGQKK